MSETKRNKNAGRNTAAAKTKGRNATTTGTGRNTAASRKKSRRHITPAYRRLVIRYKIIAAVFIVLMLALGIPNIFTHKREYRELGVELYEQGNFSEAVSEFEKALDEKQWFSEKLDVDVLMYESSAYLKLDDYTSAKAVYEKILSDYPDKYYDSEEISYLSGLCDTMLAYEDGKYSDTLDALKAACDRGYTELALCVAICYENVQNYDEMENYLNLYTQSNQADAYVYCKFADLYLEKEDYTSAMSSIESALSFNEAEYMQELYYRQIICCEGLGDYARAYELSESYVESYPADEDGIKLNTFLETRANPDTEVINDIFGVNPGAEDKTSVEIMSVE
jgi:tetratricopeptide (TPR) repeat protein